MINPLDFPWEFKVREMQNSSEFFKSNFDYHQRVAHKREKFSFRFSHISISDQWHFLKSCVFQLIFTDRAD